MYTNTPSQPRMQPAAANTHPTGDENELARRELDCFEMLTLVSPNHQPAMVLAACVCGLSDTNAILYAERVPIDFLNHDNHGCERGQVANIDGRVLEEASACRSSRCCRLCCVCGHSPDLLSGEQRRNVGL